MAKANLKPIPVKSSVDSIHMEIDDDTGVEKETILDISKTYIEHNLYNSAVNRNERGNYSLVCNFENECSIKIKLKITPLK